MALDPSSVDLPALAFLAGSAANDVVQERLRAAGHRGLRQSHGFVFQHLVDGSPTVGELAAALGVTQQAASKSARELEDLGYVRRRADAGDRRVTRLELTARGRDAVASARRLRRELEDELVGRVGPRAATQVRRALAELLDLAGGTGAVRTRAVRPPD